MELMSNGFNVGSGSDGNQDSISRYLGGNLGEISGMGFDSDALGGMDFSSILKSQMATGPIIDSKLDATLQRLEAGEPMVNMTPEEAAKAIFASIDEIMLGVKTMLQSLGTMPASIHENFQDLTRLIEGAKQLFDVHENPMVIEALGEVWGQLKKKKSPAFHSVHSYFLEISIASHTKAGAALDPSVLDQSDVNFKAPSREYNYSSESFTLFYSVVESLEPCDEKDTILDAFNLDVLDSESSDDIESTQSAA